MTQSSQSIEVYLEIGKKRTFAGALDWPGWCRSGRGEDAALQALVESGPRYARVLDSALGFHAPGSVAECVVVERLAGTTTTDFGAPDVAPSGDARPLDEAALRRLEALLTAAWRAFDTAVEEAIGKALHKGPRGGGRELDGIVQHVLGAERGYLTRLAWKPRAPAAEDLEADRGPARQEVLQALAAAARGELPTRGPRGGVVWAPRYFVRRAAWHVLDHVWEIEDRLA